VNNILRKFKICYHSACLALGSRTVTLPTVKLCSVAQGHEIVTTDIHAKALYSLPSSLLEAK